MGGRTSAGWRRAPGPKRVHDTVRCPSRVAVREADSCAPSPSPRVPRSRATRTAGHRRPGRSRHFTASNSVQPASGLWVPSATMTITERWRRRGLAYATSEAKGCTLLPHSDQLIFDGMVSGCFFWVRSPVSGGPVATRAAASQWNARECHQRLYLWTGGTERIYQLGCSAGRGCL